MATALLTARRLLLLFTLEIVSLANRSLSLAHGILNCCDESAVFTFRIAKVAPLSCAAAGQRVQKHCEENV